MNAPFACTLENRGIIRLSGADRRGFLQGLISNDVALCTPGHAIYAALLTPQGKFLHDLFVIEDGDEFLIDCESARAEDLVKRLNVHRLRAKISIAGARDEFDVWAMWGQGSEARGQGTFVDPRLPQLGLRAILKKEIPEPSIPAPETPSYDRHRLMLGVADGSRDLIIEKSTLIEGNFDLLNGISWSKGCYMGQELMTARMHYRGLAKKRLFPVAIEGAAPAPGTPVTLEDQEAGEMRSSNGKPGLALLNIEKAEAAIISGAAFVCGDAKLRASKPEWMEDRKVGGA